MTEKMAEVHGNRTHLPGYSPGTPDLKSGRATSALSTSTCQQHLPVVLRKNNFFLSCGQKMPAENLKNVENANVLIVNGM